MMRACRRIATRAGLPVKYTQGFNPRPILSLACPRPVGVASRADLLVVALTDEITPPEMRRALRRMNEHCPPGIRFVKARSVAAKSSLRPRRAEYQIPLPGRRQADVARRLAELERTDCWSVERLTSARRGRGSRRFEARRIDLKPLVTELRLDRQMLHMTLTPQGDTWARPAEVLKLLDMDDRVDLAAVVRTAVEYENLNKQETQS